jgi:hypothetical protein
MIKSNGDTQIVLDFDLKVVRQCLVVDTFEHPTPMKNAAQLYSHKGLRYSR